MTTRQLIDDFLAHKRLAVIGVSHAPKDFTRTMFAEFVKREYDAVPVNPALGEVEGRRCYARVQDIQPGVDAALVMTRPEVTDRVVRDCAEAGIRQVWLYRAVGKGAVSPRAVEFCQSHGIEVVAGYCPFMFLPASGFPHNFHGVLKRIGGTYPV